MTDVKTYWNRIDEALSRKNLTMTEMAAAIGYKRETIYYQKRKGQFPKVKQMEAIENFLGINPLEEGSVLSPFAEYIPYLEQAEAWQIKAVRELLKMPPLEDCKKKNETCAV